jgi:hypothetical protein
MCEDATIRIEIGPHLKDAISELIDAYECNVQSETYCGPAGAIESAFGIDFDKMLKTTLKGCRGAKDVKINMTMECKS